MGLEDEAESRKKLDEQKKLQKELRQIEKLSCVPKEFQESLKTGAAERGAKEA